MSFKRYGEFLGMGNEKVLELDRNNDCTTLRIC